MKVFYQIEVKHFKENLRQFLDLVTDFIYSYGLFKFQSNKSGKGYDGQ